VVSNPNGLPRPFRLSIPFSPVALFSCFKPERASQAISPSCSLDSILFYFAVSNPNGLPRPFRRFWFSHLARSTVSFQTRTGFPGHFASGTHSIAWEATLCNTLRGSLFSGVFLRAKGTSQRAIFASGPFWSDARVYAQKSDHCDPRSMVAFTR